MSFGREHEPIERVRASARAGIRCFRGKNACVARAPTFYFRMKHTIRGHERETNVETCRTGGAEKKPLRGKRRRGPAVERGEKERLYLCPGESDTGEEREKETDRQTDRCRMSREQEKKRETVGREGERRRTPGEEMRDREEGKEGMKGRQKRDQPRGRKREGEWRKGERE